MADQAFRERGEALAAVLPPLLVAAERVAAVLAPGEHGRRRAGPGESFWQYRRYQPGDPARSIDWRRSAKSDPLYVREHEWTSAQTVWLWCDRSASMDYRSKRTLPRKEDRAALLTVALAALLSRGGERIGLLGGGEAPAMGRQGLVRLAEILSRPAGEAPDLKALPVPAAHAHVVLMGDFLDPLEDIQALVRNMAGAGAVGHLLQVLDPAEETLPFKGRVRFTGVEGEGEALITRTEEVRADYTKRMGKHREAVKALALAHGWTFSFHHTDSSPEIPLLTLYELLSRQGSA